MIAPPFQFNSPPIPPMVAGEGADGARADHTIGERRRFLSASKGHVAKRSKHNFSQWFERLQTFGLRIWEHENVRWVSPVHEVEHGRETLTCVTNQMSGVTE